MQKTFVFDSGIGGFSVLKEMMTQHLPLSITYLADQVNFPYGNKTPSWLTDRLTKIGSWAKTKNPELFVLACNTATVSAVETIRQVLPCPVIGIEPVVKLLSSYERALILATHVTVSSPRTRALVDEFGPHIQVDHALGLAEAIENNDIEQVKNILNVIAERVETNSIQAIGLSCTHYPLVVDQLAARVPGVHIYDPSVAVVHQIKKKLTTQIRGVQTISYLTSGSVVRFKEQVLQYFGDGHTVGEWSL